MFLILLSSDYIDSDYCHLYEVRCILDRHESGSAIVLPIIAGTCNWKRVTSLAELHPLPKSGRPITTSNNPATRDRVLASVTSEIEQIVYRLLEGKESLNASEMATLGKQRFEDVLVREWLVKDIMRQNNRDPSPELPRTTSLFLASPSKSEPTLMLRGKKKLTQSMTNQTTSKGAGRHSQRKEKQQLSDEDIFLPMRRKSLSARSFHESLQDRFDRAKFEYRVCFQTSILLWLTVTLSIFDLVFLFVAVSDWPLLPQGIVILSIILSAQRTEKIRHRPRNPPPPRPQSNHGRIFKLFLYAYLPDWEAREAPTSYATR